MFDSSEKSTGTGYTETVALLSVAFIFSPAVLMVSRPFGYVALLLAIAVSITCVTLAWANREKSSQFGIPTFGPSTRPLALTQREQAK